MENNKIYLRTNILKQDVENVTEILSSTNFFRKDEIDVAIELVEETISKGKEAGYEFVFAEIDNKTVAYTCFGSIPCSVVSFDLYWIATHQDYRGKGIGKIILQKTEEIVKILGGRSIYIETSSKPLYESTRQFYLSNNYNLEALFEDFYDIGDGKCVYVKKL